MPSIPARVEMPGQVDVASFLVKSHRTRRVPRKQVGLVMVEGSGSGFANSPYTPVALYLLGDESETKTIVVIGRKGSACSDFPFPGRRRSHSSASSHAIDSYHHQFDNKLGRSDFCFGAQPSQCG